MICIWGVKIKKKPKEKKKDIKKHKEKIITPESIDEVVKVAEKEEKPQQKAEQVGEVVEKIHEEINGKKEEKTAAKESSDYKPENSDYNPYAPGAEISENKFSAASEDIAVDDDVTLHRFRKDTDPLEYLQRGKYNKPWDNPFLCYIRDGINDRVRRINSLARNGFRSMIHGAEAVYHTLYGWVYSKK